MEIKEINPQAAGSVHWKFWYLWSNRCLLLAWPWSTPLNWHIIPFLLPIFFSLLLDWKGRDNLGLERAVKPGTLLIHLHTGQACWGQPLLDIFTITAKICRTEMFTSKRNNDRSCRSESFEWMIHEIRKTLFLPQFQWSCAALPSHHDPLPFNSNSLTI